MKILVATDGSRAGAAAVRFASSLLDGGPKGELVVLTVDACPGTAPAAKDRRGECRNAKKALQKAAGQMRRRGVLARYELVRTRDADEVPEVISRQADRLRADLIVVGSEGRESLTEWVVGGTALRLIYVARRPVTVVRAPRRRLPR
ncbi:MAG: universal stress protein [Thermoanaerobaculia bacterium]